MVLHILISYLDHNSFQRTIVRRMCIDIPQLYSGIFRHSYKDCLLHIHRHLSKLNNELNSSRITDAGFIIIKSMLTARNCKKGVTSLRLTFVAVLSFVVIRALTVIVANSVNTGASVLARPVHGTLVHI